MLCLDTFLRLRNVDVSFVIYVCLSVRSALFKGILIKFDIREFFENMFRKFKFH